MSSDDETWELVSLVQSPAWTIGTKKTAHKQIESFNQSFSTFVKKKKEKQNYIHLPV